MSYLAEIWQRQGKISEARSLLLECLPRLLAAGRTAEGSERKRFEEWFQNHRKTFIRLFPGESLEQFRIPATAFR